MTLSTQDEPDAEEAVEQLRKALARHGVTLPSLDVDKGTYSHLTPRPLIELGRCNVATAQRLAAALNGEGQCAEKGAAR
ncbi:hypothetical protein ACTWP5_28625 [Streptomyces sp. 4N509B]|uniref:hypothetical protein n=1 Tax=Streptomyces sp. 4N509B TaxID=3457413 RepID=UPI003FD154D2